MSKEFLVAFLLTLLFWDRTSCAIFCWTLQQWSKCIIVKHLCSFFVEIYSVPCYAYNYATFDDRSQSRNFSGQLCGITKSIAFALIQWFPRQKVLVNMALIFHQKKTASFAFLPHCIWSELREHCLMTSWSFVGLASLKSPSFNASCHIKCFWFYSLYLPKTH